MIRCFKAFESVIFLSIFDNLCTLTLLEQDGIATYRIKALISSYIVT